MRTLLIHLSILVYVTCDSEYQSKREKLIRDEYSIAVGGNVNLTKEEELVNKCIMKHKFEELDYAFNNPRYFNFSHHFFSYREKIYESKVFKIIQDMPKGAILHVHDTGILGPDYLLNVTYKDHLYICMDTIEFRFSNNTPNLPCTSKWKLMKEARKASKNVTKFDLELRKHFTLVVDDPDVVYPSITESWNKFMEFFGVVFTLMTYRPVWEQYFYDTLKYFREDNIMYAEIRSTLPCLYELDGTVYDQLITAKAFRKAVTKFVKDYPDFIGAKLIYAPIRKTDTATVTEYLQLANKIKNDMPDAFAGFDLVGQEDLGSPLIDFVPELLAEKDLNYFFHAGETDWYGTSTDENLIDAILLGTKRLGHAYALAKHPLLVQEVIKRGIGIEVNIISNTVLSLVRDVRNHPLNIFLAHGLPVVLSSDDPGAWEADAISEDFYVAFVGVASRKADLRLLKALAINSLVYSALDNKDKNDALSKFNLRWNHFIEKFKCDSY